MSIKSRQINFFISEAKEKDLYEFITNSCDCVIYTIIDDKITNESELMVQVLLVMCKSMNPLAYMPPTLPASTLQLAYDWPLLRYERFLTTEKGEIQYRRFWLPSDTHLCSKHEQKQIESVLAKIKDWIARTSTYKEKEGCITVFYLT